MTHSNLPHTPEAGTPTAVQTNGENKPTTAHLNLTRTFADVIASQRDFLNIHPSKRGQK